MKYVLKIYDIYVDGKIPSIPKNIITIIGMIHNNGNVYGKEYRILLLPAKGRNHEQSSP